MADIEKITKKLLKSTQFPEISADFNLKVMDEIKLIPKPKSIIDKPLIHPLVLWLGLLIPVLITGYLYFSGFTLESKFLEAFAKFNIFHYLEKITANYLITAYALLVLLWFIIDYKLMAVKKSNFFNKKFDLK